MNGRNLYCYAGLSVFLARLRTEEEEGCNSKARKAAGISAFTAYPHPLDWRLTPHSGLKSETIFETTQKTKKDLEEWKNRTSKLMLDIFSLRTTIFESIFSTTV